MQKIEEVGDQTYPIWLRMNDRHMHNLLILLCMLTPTEISFTVILWPFDKVELGLCSHLAVALLHIFLISLYPCNSPWSEEKCSSVLAIGWSRTDRLGTSNSFPDLSDINLILLLYLGSPAPDSPPSMLSGHSQTQCNAHPSPSPPLKRPTSKLINRPTSLPSSSRSLLWQGVKISYRIFQFTA